MYLKRRKKNKRVLSAQPGQTHVEYLRLGRWHPGIEVKRERGIVAVMTLAQHTIICASSQVRSVGGAG